MSAHEAGRELDAEIAEKVMGFGGRAAVYAWADRVKRVHPVVAFTSTTEKGWSTLAENSYSTWMSEAGEKITRCYIAKKYSTEIADAWLVVDSLTSRGIRVVIRTHSAIGDCPRVEVFGNHAKGIEWMLHANAATVPLAICLAALNAVEVAR